MREPRSVAMSGECTRLGELRRAVAYLVSSTASPVPMPPATSAAMIRTATSLLFMNLMLPEVRHDRCHGQEVTTPPGMKVRQAGVFVS